MVFFEKLLLAVDLSPESDQLLTRVFKICQGKMERVAIVHVLRAGSFGVCEWDDLTNVSVLDNDRVLERRWALGKLTQLLNRNGFVIPADRIHIRTGEPANEIKQLAHTMEVDLVIVGSHCKGTGWLNLPGATTNCVLQGIDTDVMAVRI